MTDIAGAIKAEITRLSRKEIKAQLEPFQNAAKQHKAQIAALKGEIGTLRAEIKALNKRTKHVVEPTEELRTSSMKMRFTANGLATLRQKLALSLDDMGVLLDASGQSVRNWEEGSTFPREKNQQAYFALRGIGKREAAVRLAAAKALPEPAAT